MARIRHYWYKTNMTHEQVIWRACLDRRPAIVHTAFGAPSVGTFDYLVPGYWCLYLFLPPWEGKSEVDGIEFPFSPGYAVVVPPGVKQRYQFFARSTHLYAHFRLSKSRKGRVPLPGAQHMGAQFQTFANDFEQLIHSTYVSRRRAEVKLWDMLWDLSQRSRSEDITFRAGGDQLAARVARQIEAELATPLSLQSLASQAGVTPTHLTRLFKAYTGKTVVRFIRERRVAHARHLLRTTSRPIKSIAHEVGLPDLHHFNKTVRAVLGSSPRRVRGG